MEELVKFNTITKEDLQDITPLILDAFTKSLDASKKTRETYTRALIRYTHWLEERETPVTSAKRQTILDYKNTLIEAGKKPSTINSALSSIRALYSFLEAEGVMPNVAAHVKNLRVEKGIAKDPLTERQGRKLMEYISGGETLEQLRNKVIICLMLEEGLRCCEVSRANIEDYGQAEGKTVLYVQRKGHCAKDSVSVINDALSDDIYKYLSMRAEVEGKALKLQAPFVAGVGNRNMGGRMTERSISRIAKDALKEINLNSARLTAHSLRHTFATLADQAGAEGKDIQEAMGHKSFDTTSIYIHRRRRIQNAPELKVSKLLRG
jgi:site-specific recombinase XerD